jgi:hypothetical protein
MRRPLSPHPARQRHRKEVWKWLSVAENYGLEEEAALADFVGWREEREKQQGAETGACRGVTAMQERGGVCRWG